MRKFLIIFLFLVLGALGYLTYAHLSGGALPTFGLPVGGERAQIRSQALRFFEHVKFKNTKALKTFVSSERSPQDIDNFLARTFNIDASNIDLHSLAVENIELDSSRRRARVRVKMVGQDLTTSKAFELSKVFFFYLADKDLWLVDIDNVTP